MRYLLPLLLILYSATVFAQQKVTSKTISPNIAPTNSAKPAVTSCDCKDAVKININKSTKYGETQAPNGFGAVQEITAANKSDKLNFEKEHNTAWYLLTLSLDGEFVFEITPKDSSNDYDFIVYKYTDSNFCTSLLKKQVKPLRSNLSRDDERLKGFTGLTSDAKNEFVGAGIGQAWSKSLQGKKGDKFMLVLDNVYPDGKGHTIKFNYVKQATITGIVIGPDSLPIKAEVLLSDNNGTTVKQIETGKDGKYSFTAGLKEGLEYTLVFSGDKSFIETKTINTAELQKRPEAFTDIRTILPKLKKGEKYKLKSINFVGGTDILLYASHASVEALYHLMKKNKNMVIRIEGHVNGSGTTTDGLSAQELSELRSLRVYDYLVQKGIEKERMEIIGFGDTKMLFPKAKNETEAAVNRRVEINVLSFE
jgi:outer membrane protein OmpA-like peptidoglycan-associated protein